MTKQNPPMEVRRAMQDIGLLVAKYGADVVDEASARRLARRAGSERSEPEAER